MSSVSLSIRSALLSEIAEILHVSFNDDNRKGKRGFIVSEDGYKNLRSAGFTLEKLKQVAQDTTSGISVTQVSDEEVKKHMFTTGNTRIDIIPSLLLASTVQDNVSERPAAAQSRNHI